jgi:membrane-bound serine protease (ClpP class)
MKSLTYRTVWIWLYVCLLLACISLAAFPRWVQAQSDQPRVLLLVADDPVAPAMVEYIRRGLRNAEAHNFEAVILQLNTPGGTLSAMNTIIQDIRSSSVPVVVWIAPQGAMAASAGTLITLAGHASAMAPETSIGAASPVGSQGEELGETLAAKEKNILRATVRSLASRRGEEAVRLAEDTIESATAVSAEEALEIGLIDFIAEDIDRLTTQLDGFSVEVAGETQVLNTAGASVVPFEETLIERLLSVLSNPNIVFLLIAIGVQAILIEISSPGGWVAGFIGVVCIALATYGLGILPVNWFGIVFLLTAFVLFILDIKAPTHGALTIAGVISLIVGALVLFNSPNVPSFQRVSVPLVVVTSIFTGLIFFGILLFAIRAQKAPIRVGQENLAGRTGTVRREIAPSGIVQLGGEQWSAELAEGEDPLPVGTLVIVERVEGLRLIVRKAK